MVFLYVKEVQMKGFRRSIPQRHHHAMLPLPVLSMLPPFSMFPNGGEHSSHQFHISRRKKEARGRKMVPDIESPLWLVPWEDPEGWDGEGGGRGDRDGEHM